MFEINEMYTPKMYCLEAPPKLNTGFYGTIFKKKTIKIINNQT